MVPGVIVIEFARSVFAISDFKCSFDFNYSRTDRHCRMKYPVGNIDIGF